MDWKYILKRVIVGVLLFIIIYFLKSYIFLSVQAKSIETVQWGSHQFTPTSNTQQVTFSTPNYWLNRGTVILRFSFSTYTPNNRTPIINDVLAYSGPGNAFACSFGTVNQSSSSVSSNNTSSFNNNIVSYSVECPINLGSSGLTNIQLNFLQWPDTTNDYTITFGNYLTMESLEDSTQSIINNQNDNTQDIIDNQNSNLEQQIESQKVCSNVIINSSQVITEKYYLSNNGTVTVTNNNWGITDYFELNSSSSINVENDISGYLYSCFYDIDKNVISCFLPNTVGSITVPSNAYYFRSSISITTNKPIITIKTCKNGNQAIADSQQQINDSLTNSDIDSTTGNDFFDDFNYGDDSLSAVITAPLRFFNKLTDTCTPISLTLFNQTITIPCGSIVWGRSDFSSFVSWWNLFFGGIAIYTLGLKLFKVVHDAIDPQKDNIESVGV